MGTTLQLFLNIKPIRKLACTFSSFFMKGISKDTNYRSDSEVGLSGHERQKVEESEEGRAKVWKKKNVQRFCTFFPVLRNNFFFFFKFLPFYFWDFGEPTVYRILCVEFPPPKFNAFQVFYRKMNAFGFCESCLFSSNIIDLPSFFF